MAEELTALAPVITDSLPGGSDIVNVNSLTDAGESIASSSPPPPDDTAISPPPPDDTAISPPPPESTPTPDPPPPPDSSPPPPSPPPPTPSSSSPPPPPPESSPPPTDTTTAASPPPPVTESLPTPVTPVTDNTPVDTGTTPSLQLPQPSVSAGTTTPAVTNDKPSSSSSSSPGTPHSSRGGGSPGKGSKTTSGDASPTSSSSTNNNTGLIVALVVSFAIIIALVMIGVICCCKKKKKKQMYSLAPGGGGHLHGHPRPSNRNMPGDHIVKLPPPPGSGGGAGGGINSGEYSFGAQNQGLPISPNMGLGVNTCSFTYQDLSAATGGFSDANVIGQGGFGFVYKGVLPNGKEVAVKSLKAGSGQGDREFQAEVEIISRVHHRYLVSLVGYCIADGQRILVYDFVPNNTLEYHLHGNGQPTMDWGTRLKIATGSAKGLAYLHEDCHPRIIHRDIKAANILIDYNFEAQVADFGLAKLTVDNNTHVSTRVMGTFGYLAPEYASSGKLSEKSDVFSFGVMLLELITGRKPVDHTGKMEDSLVDWARPHLAKAQEDGNYNDIADPHMEGKYDHNEMSRMVACASTSVRHSARRRPKMSQIVRALEGNLSFDALNNDSKPGQGMGANGNDSSVYDTGEYNADMTKFRQMVMSDSNSSEFGDSSEY